MKLLILASIFSLFGSNLAQAQDSWVEVGDMLVPADTLVSQGVSARGFKLKKAKLWPGGILPISFSAEIGKAEQQEFLSYCEEMGEYADVRCVEKENSDRAYIHVAKTTRKFCGQSAVGRTGGKQELLIRCWRKRTIQHELMHAMGITHEHNRMDRDDHIEILWKNMKLGSRWNYQKVALGKISHHLSFYDYDSIMHYDSRSGSANGKIVFYRKDLGPDKGYVKQSDDMSYGDHSILYALYGGKRPRP